MSKKLFSSIENTLPEPFGHKRYVNPAIFDDPIALKTKWESIAGSASGITSHRLVSLNTERVEFRHTIFFKIMMFTIGAIVGFVLWIAGLISLRGDILPFVLLVLVPLTGMAAASIRSPIVFDKQIGFFWKGRTSPANVIDISTIKRCARLQDIYALQLLKTVHCSPNGRGSYYNYQINLVLHSGERVHVIYYAKKNKALKDAAALSRFLGVPLWNAGDCMAHDR